MESFSLEDFFITSKEQSSPGTNLYLYRLLHLLADGERTGDSPTISYHGARRLAVRLGLDTSEKLVALFRDLGLGDLQIDMDPGAIVVTLENETPTPPLPTGHPASCELERGIIDGALELISGVPVTSREASCRTRGHDCCRFEAVLDSTSDRPRYVPGLTSGYSPDPAPGMGRQGISPTQIRSWYLEMAARELSRSRRHERQLSLVYVDLDDLGQVNAEHGRSVGDQIISAVSAALSRSCRAEDYLWHNGEDEFAIILSETGSNTADKVAQRLSTAILSAAENIEFAAKISASIGFASFPEHADNLTSLLESARSALYLAKASGKGKTQVAVRDLAEGRATAVRESISSAADAPTKGEEFEPRRSLTEPEAELEVEDKRADSGQVELLVAMSGPLLMAGIKQIIGAEDDMHIIDLVSEPSRLPDIIEDLRPELVIADMAMAIEDDFAALRQIQEENLPCKFIVFADVVDQEVIKLAADFKIDGIVLQSATPKEMVSAIKAAYGGQTVIPEEAKTAMKDLESKRKLLSELSDRELDVLKLIAEGKSNSQISDDLYITVNTVRFHLANIYQKLSVSNRTEAANCYLKQDIEADNQPRLL